MEVTKANWFPGAKQRQIDSKVRSRNGVAPNALIHHIAAGNSLSLYSFFSSPTRGCSHFYVLMDGSAEQYLPISSKSGSEKEGNARTISIETQGGAGATTDKPWTDAQAETLAKICAWVHEEWGIPLKLMANSRTGTAGIGYHRLGIDGNFPDDPLYGGRTERGGGERWSDSLGKTCPENYTKPPRYKSRIAQIPDKIIPRAIELAASTPTPPKPPTPKPPTPTPPKEVTVKAVLQRLDLRNAGKEAVTGRDVGRLQGLLLAQGYGPSGLVGKDGKPDKKAGAMTKKYVGQFQVKTNTGDGEGHADFVVGEGTWTALLEK